MRRLYVGWQVRSNENSIASICFHKVAVVEVVIVRIIYAKTCVGTCVGALFVTCVGLVQGTFDGHLQRALMTGNCEGQLRRTVATGGCDEHLRWHLHRPCAGVCDGNLRRAVAKGSCDRYL